MELEDIKQLGYEEYISCQPIAAEQKRRKKRVANCYLQYLSEYQKPIAETTLIDIEGYLGTLSYLKETSYNTSYVYTLRDFYRYLYQSKLIAIDWGDYITKKKTPQTLPRNIPLNLMLQLCTPTKTDLKQLEKSVVAIRNQAIIEFLFSTGVRGSELLEAKIQYLSSDLSECFIPTKKKGTPRYVYLGKSARKYLGRYLQKRGINNFDQLNSSQLNDYIFVNKNSKKLSKTSLNNIVQACAKKRIGTVVTPHMFRHTFATEMLRSSGCLRTVQLLLGHTSIASTQKYCHLDISDRMAAIEEFHPRSQKTNKK